MNEALQTPETPAPEAQEPEKKAPIKRDTIASVRADFKTLESFMDEEIIPAIELIEDRVNKIIEGLKQTPTGETPIPEAKLQEHNNLIDINTRQIERTARIQEQMQEDLNTIIPGMNIMQDAIVNLQEAETAEEPSTSHLMSDTPTFQDRENDIRHLANLSISMSDVLLICRFLKAETKISEEVRIETLHVACQRAGVPVSAGMKARAGVKFVEA